MKLFANVTVQARNLVMVAALSFPVMAFAAEVQIGGSASGSFDGASPSCAATLLGLSYSCGVFSAMTSGGTADISGANGDFGTFTNSPGNQPSGSLGTFSLWLSFTSPLGISSTPDPIYNAAVTGTITNNSSSGAVLITFSNYSKTFSFSNSENNGGFTLSLNDVTIAAGQSAALVGVITGAYQTPNSAFIQDVPEPGTALLLVAGLASLTLRVQRHRLAEKSKEQHRKW